jgi:hypothetical protein
VVTLEHVFAEVEERTAADAADLFGQKQVPEVRRKYDGRWVVGQAVQPPVTAGRKRPLSTDRSRFADEYRELAKPYWREALPKLGGRFEVLAPSTGNKGKGAYNSIAWSLGANDRWVWPGEALEDFDRLYAELGYRLSRVLNFDHQPGYQKVVLYGKVEGGKVVARHAAAQLTDGSWTSKLGGGPLIRHLELDDLKSDAFGAPVAVYVRRMPESKTPQAPPSPSKGKVSDAPQKR